jgi:hypothetical protein
VSLKPPLKPLVRGVRIASVTTTSSGFLVVLFDVQVRYYSVSLGVGVNYIAAMPELPGFRWLRRDERRSTAMVMYF